MQLRLKLNSYFRLCTWAFTQHILQILLKQLMQFSRYSTVYTLKFTFSSEHAVAHWVFTNNEPGFARLFVNNLKKIFKRFIGECQLPIQYLNRLLNSRISTSCSNTRCCGMMLLRYQWTSVANDSISSTKQSLRPIHDHPLAYPSSAFAVVVLHQSRSSLTCSLRKMYFYIQIVIIFKSNQTL